MRHIQTIKHGVWTTVIEKSKDYRVTTFSSIRDIELQTFAKTIEESKTIAFDHMRQVSGL